MKLITRYRTSPVIPVADILMLGGELLEVGVSEVGGESDTRVKMRRMFAETYKFY